MWIILLQSVRSRVNKYYWRRKFSVSLYFPDYTLIAPVFFHYKVVYLSVNGITVKQVDRSVHRPVKVWSLSWAQLWSLLWTQLWSLFEHTGGCWYAFMWCSPVPIRSCSLLSAQSTLPSIRTRALSPVTWRSWKGRRSWWPRRKGSGGPGASITELESSPPIMSGQKIQTWVHVVRIYMRYFLSVLFCWYPALRQGFWAEVNVLDRKENP